MTSNEATITCPKCGAAVPLTETLAGPLLEQTRREYEERLERSREAGEQLVQRIKMREIEVAAKEELLAATVTSRVRVREAELRASMQREAAESEAELRASAQREAAESVRSVHAEAATLRAQLAEAQKAQAEAVRKERELEGRERAVTLTIEQGITAGVTSARDQARREADEAARLRLMEKDALLQSMEVKVAELQQKLIQGSQQSQGEVQEEDMKVRLREAFPRDTVDDVGKGIQGADLVQQVEGGVGVILLESKRTKNFSVGWLSKLREDGRAARADVLVLASQALPSEIEGFGCQEGVWICAPRYVIPLVAVLRETLLSVARERRSAEGQETRAVVVYKYVTGAQFRRRVESLVEAFTTMKEDLDSERRALARAWAKRETQLERALLGAAGLVGDVQALGEPGAIAEIEGLSMKALGEGVAE